MYCEGEIDFPVDFFRYLLCVTISFEFSYFSTICFTGTDPEDVIKNAFGCFDEENAGFIHEDRLRELLTTMGDRFTDEQVDEMYREVPLKHYRIVSFLFGKEL